MLETQIDTSQTAVKKGDVMQLVGLGTFKSAKRAARTGKNPSTGAALKIPASTVPKFVAGAKFKAVVDPKEDKAGKQVPLVRPPPEQTATGSSLWRFFLGCRPKAEIDGLGVRIKTWTGFMPHPLPTKLAQFPVGANKYELSETGMELLVRIVLLWTWIVENADRFREARQSFDSQHDEANP